MNDASLPLDDAMRARWLAVEHVIANATGSDRTADATRTDARDLVGELLDQFKSHLSTPAGKELVADFAAANGLPPEIRTELYQAAGLSPNNEVERIRTEFDLLAQTNPPRRGTGETEEDFAQRFGDFQEQTRSRTLRYLDRHREYFRTTAGLKTLDDQSRRQQLPTWEVVYPLVGERITIALDREEARLRRLKEADSKTLSRDDRTGLAKFEQYVEELRALNERANPAADADHAASKHVQFETVATIEDNRGDAISPAAVPTILLAEVTGDLDQCDEWNLRPLGAEAPLTPAPAEMPLSGWRATTEQNQAILAASAADKPALVCVRYYSPPLSQGLQTRWSKLNGKLLAGLTRRIVDHHEHLGRDRVFNRVRGMSNGGPNSLVMALHLSRGPERYLPDEIDLVEKQGGGARPELDKDGYLVTDAQGDPRWAAITIDSGPIKISVPRVLTNIDQYGKSFSWLLESGRLRINDFREVDSLISRGLMGQANLGDKIPHTEFLTREALRGRRAHVTAYMESPEVQTQSAMGRLNQRVMSEIDTVHQSAQRIGSSTWDLIKAKNEAVARAKPGQEREAAHAAIATEMQRARRLSRPLLRATLVAVTAAVGKPIGMLVRALSRDERAFAQTTPKHTPSLGTESSTSRRSKSRSGR